MVIAELSYWSGWLLFPLCAGLALLVGILCQRVVNRRRQSEDGPGR